jgi:hypothetical protein
VLRSKTALPVIATAALLLSACGDDGGDGGGADKVSPGDYSADICTAFTGWRDTIQKQQDDLQTGLQPNITPAEGKQALEGFLGDTVEASNKLVEDVDAAGVPDADKGEEVADALKGAAESARDKLEDAEAKVADLPTDSRTAFGAAADQFGNDIREALSAVGEGLQDINSTEIEKAFQDEPACSGS